MASSADSIIQTLLAGTGFGRTVGDFQQQQAAIDASRQQAEFNGFRVSEAQRQAFQQQQYQADIQAYLRDPKPETLQMLAVKYPDQAEQLQKSYSVQDEAQKTSRLTMYGSLYNAANLGRIELVKTRLQAVKAAEAARGMDTSSLDDALMLIDQDPKTALNAVKGIAQINIAAAKPGAFAQETAKAAPGTDNGYTLAPGSQRYDAAGNLIASAPFAPRPVTVGEGQTVFEYQPEGGGPVSGGAGGASSTGIPHTGGWTPRARNGGDNSDEAVDAKISGAAQYLGVSPSADISKVSPMRIAEAMALSEGGPGSLADRNNNPANIRNPDGSFKRFPSKQAGLNAAAALVSRKLRNGQTTVQSLIEGLPVANSRSSPRILVQGAPKQNDAPSGYRWTADGNLEPIPGGPGDARYGTQNRKGEADLRKEFDNLPEVKNFQTVRSAMGNIRTLAQNPNAQNDIALIFSYMKVLDPTSVVREREFATAQNAAGVTDQIRNSYNRALSGERLNQQQRMAMAGSAAKIYLAQRDIYNQRADQYRSYAGDYGVNPDRVAQKYAQTRQAAQPARIATPKEWAALPSGTQYVDPTGKLRVKR